MTQEDKMLLIKNLSSRLPYSVHVQHTSGFSGVLHGISMHHKYDKNNNVYDIICYTDFFGDGDSITIEHFKPYLFPLSSMTNGQKEELNKKFNVQFLGNTICSIHYHSEGCWDTDLELDFQDWLWFINWCYKNHFDVNKLIEKGLAIDATELNIY